LHYDWFNDAIIESNFYRRCEIKIPSIKQSIDKTLKNFSTLKSSSFSLFIGGMFAVQSFLVIGGFLTAYLQMKKMEKEITSSISLFLREVAGRYIRFASLLALTVLIHSTWLYRFGSGPFWDQVNLTERQFCRENGWTNLLFLDNYISIEHKCLIHR
jgi:peptidoglycan/LPS O-acetylase OafA/YrhL